MSSNIFMDDYINSILAKIYTNQNLCKLLLIDDNDSPTSYLDILDTKVLFTNKSNQRIYATPFNIDIVDTQRTTLTINISDASLCRGNAYFKNIKLRFFILCPYMLWELNSSVEGESVQRPNAIINELLDTFNRERTIGLGKNNFVRMYAMYPNEYIGGFCLELEGVDFVN